MAKELTMQQLEREFRGEPEVCKVKFLTGNNLNVPESKNAGHRVYHKIPYIMRYFDDVKDRVSRPATQKEIDDHPVQFAAYEERIRNGEEDVYEGWEEVRSDRSGREHDRVPADCQGV